MVIMSCFTKLWFKDPCLFSASEEIVCGYAIISVISVSETADESCSAKKKGSVGCSGCSVRWFVEKGEKAMNSHIYSEETIIPLRDRFNITGTNQYLINTDKASYMPHFRRATGQGGWKINKNRSELKDVLILE